MQTLTRDRKTCGIVGFVALAMLIFNLNCGKNGDGSLKAQETTPESPQATKQVQTELKPSTAWQRFSQALTDGKYVYVFFYESENPNCEVTEECLDSFARNTRKKVEVIKIDRKDPKNRDIVTELRAQSAPIPLTLLVYPNGAIVAAFTKVVISEEELTQAFPSPKKAEALKYVQEGKAIILCFSNKEMSSRGEVQTCCSKAKNELAGKAEYISVDLSDPKEAAFMRELKIDPNIPEPVTFVINPQGQVTGNYRGGVQVNDLVQAATKVVKGGCCPVGSGKSCAPTKEKKK